MCGRAANGMPWPKLAKAVGGARGDEDEHRVSYNICPSEGASCLTQECVQDGKSELVIRRFSWGLTTGAHFVINARSETVGEKAMFRRLRRCIFLATGFYEWSRVKAQKLPHYFTLGDGERLLRIAALWDQKTKQVAVLTTSANSSMSWCHTRMPVILDEDKAKTWLNEDKAMSSCLAEVKFPKLNHRPVNPKFVGNAKNKTEECIQDYGEYKKKHGLTRFFKPKTESGQKRTLDSSTISEAALKPSQSPCKRTKIETKQSESPTNRIKTETKVSQKKETRKAVTRGLAKKSTSGLRKTTLMDTWLKSPRNRADHTVKPS